MKGCSWTTELLMMMMRIDMMMMIMMMDIMMMMIMLLVNVNPGWLSSCLLYYWSHHPSAKSHLSRNKKHCCGEETAIINTQDLNTQKSKLIWKIFHWWVSSSSHDVELIIGHIWSTWSPLSLFVRIMALYMGVYWEIRSESRKNLS